MSTTIYDIGDVVRLSAEFAVDGTDTDPSALVCKTRKPDGSEALVSTNKDSTGMYHADVVVDQPGVWRYRWYGTGVAQAAGEGWFRVAPSAFA